MISTGVDLLIETRLYLDKLEGKYNENFEPEEIQQGLNKSQLRLLDDLINRNFQQGTLRYEWIRPFQQKQPGISVSWSGLSGTVDWPNDLYYYVNSNANVGLNVNPLAAYSPYGTQRKYLDVIAPSDTPTHSEVVNLDVKETGEALKHEQTVFYGNNYKTPRAEYRGGGLELVRDNTFIVTSIDVDYISKPPEIDVTSTDPLLWSSSALQKIVDYTVEYFRLTIEDPAYQANVNDFNTRTQNA